MTLILKFFSIFLFSVFMNKGFLAHAQGHSHGVGVIDVAFSVKEKQLQVELKIPLESLVGFERRPQNDKESQKLNAAVEILKGSIFKIVESTTSNCIFSVLESQIHFGDNEKGKSEKGSEIALDKQKHTKRALQKDHAEVQIKYSAQCAVFETVQGFEVILFNSFPSLARMTGQIVTDKDSQAISINKKAALVSFDLGKK